jgi:hypothetical protein
VEGIARKFVVAMLGVVLWANAPCLAACILHPCSAAPHCHHRNEAKQPCPHQLLRATAPSAHAVAVFAPLPADSPAPDAHVLPGSAGALSLTWDTGLPPPLSARTQSPALQV